jgi:hypothetical protein
VRDGFEPSSASKEGRERTTYEGLFSDILFLFYQELSFGHDLINSNVVTPLTSQFDIVLVVASLKIGGTGR